MGKSKRYVQQVRTERKHYLVKVKRSKKCRSFVFLLSLLLFVIDFVVMIQYWVAATATEMRYRERRSMFLGYSTIFNTQAIPWLFESSNNGGIAVPIMFEICVGIALMVFRVYAIKTRANDIGDFSKKDKVQIGLKSGRAVLVLVVVIVNFAAVQNAENPRIVDRAFYNECELQASVSNPIGSGGQLDTLLGNSLTVQCEQRLEFQGAPETNFRGEFPDKGLPNEAIDNGTRLVFMKPVGEQIGCTVQEEPNLQTRETRPPRKCESQDYDFSNWITRPTDNNCSAVVYNAWYEDKRLTTYHWAENWLCNLRANFTTQSMTVYFDVAGVRRRTTECSSADDPAWVQGLSAGSSRSTSDLASLTTAEKTAMSGNPDYAEWTECSAVEIACIVDVQNSLGADTNYWRALHWSGCSRSFARNPVETVDEQARVDSQEQDVKTAYQNSMLTGLLQTVWDGIEAAFHLWCPCC